MENIRPIIALQIPDIEPPAIGEKPRLEWLLIGSLRINDVYQRSLSNRSVSSIRKIVRSFDWARVKALSVVDMEDGTYEVIDGQHTAIAAASHGGIVSLPCLVSAAKSVQARAADFVGLNRDRLSMTPMQVFWAEVASEDELAVEVVQGVNSGGGNILRYPPGNARFKIGDVMCTAALKKVAAEGGPPWVKRVVSIGVQAKFAPIKAPIVGALVKLIWRNEGARPLSDEKIVSVLRIYGQEDILAKAKVYRETAGKPLGACIADIVRRLA